ncbi:hypothetical protein Bca4012_034403 [Brassica carinata]|uniref:Uncharacterized protein n=2 Tax=Brassica TaxID=3705 RepID=A0A8X7RGY3_BRACI|nr:hypothetical protein Bca52824_044748 [Brassica carinata]VDD15990.1 unnamed protein product [Brassica oleracea]
MYDNRILRYFKGHKDRVVSLCMSPINDSFMSGSLDGSVRLWDLRVNACQLEEFERAVRLSRGNCRDDTNGFFAGLSLICLPSRDAIMVVVIRKGENLQQSEGDGKHYM